MPLMGIFGSKKNDDNEPVKLPDNKEPIATNDLLLSEEQREAQEQDLALFGEQHEEHEQHLQKEAEKEVQKQAQDSFIKLQKIKLNKEKQQLKMPLLKLANQLEYLIKMITIRHLSNFRNSTDSKSQQEEGLVLLILMSFFISLEYQFPNLLY